LEHPNRGDTARRTLGRCLSGGSRFNANVTVFNAPAAAGASSILPGLDSSDVVTDYLDQTGAVTASFNDIRYVRVSIVGFTHTLLIPALLPGLPAMTLTAPAFETTLPRESLGAVPDGAGSTQCP